MIKSDIPYMNYIIDIIKDIEDSMKDTSKNNFNKDKKDANIRRLEIISESIKNISAELKNKYPDIEWKKFENLKYVFMNNYFGVDLDIVWEIIKNDIPKLKQEIEEIINKEKQVN